MAYLGWDKHLERASWASAAVVLARLSTRSEHHEHQPQLFWTVWAGSELHEPHLRLFFDLVRHEHQKRLFWAAHLTRAS